MPPKNEPTLPELATEIRNHVQRHPDDDLDAVLAYWRHMHRWGWCGKTATLIEIEQMVRTAKGVA